MLILRSTNHHQHTALEAKGSNLDNQAVLINQASVNLAGTTNLGLDSPEVSTNRVVLDTNNQAGLVINQHPVSVDSHQEEPDIMLQPVDMVCLMVVYKVAVSLQLLTMLLRLAFLLQPSL